MPEFSRFLKFTDKEGKERVLEIPFVTLTSEQENQLIELFNQQLDKETDSGSGVWLNENQSKEFVNNKNSFFEMIAQILEVSSEDELIKKLEESHSIVLTDHTFEQYDDRKKKDDTVMAEKLRKAFSDELKHYYNDETNDDKAEALIHLALNSDLVDKVEVNNNKVRFRIRNSWNNCILVVEFYPEGFIRGEQNNLMIVITYFPNKTKER